MSLEQTLAERGARYGDFSDHARIAQALQGVMRSAANPLDTESNSMEIAGYARLVEERLPKEKEGM